MQPREEFRPTARPARPISADAADDHALNAAVARPTRIVCMGGGTGLPVVLKGLARWTQPREGDPGLDLTAVVAMSDDGGSSGRLRRQRGGPPPGDIRNCLLALADEGSALKELFGYRFNGAKGVGGHAVGNLVLAALSELKGDFLEAVQLSERLLQARGHVLPSTLMPVQLVARFDDARHVVGERNIARAGGRVASVSLVPRSPPPCDGLLEALRSADLIAVGPGSLYSSVLPNLLVEGVAKALRETRAPKVLIANLMTQPGETDGMSCSDHLRAIFSHVGPLFDVVLVNGTPFSPEMVRDYLRKGAQPAEFVRRELIDLGLVPVEADLLREGRQARHDGRKVARCLLRLARVGV